MAPRCCCSTGWRHTPASGTWLRPFSPATPGWSHWTLGATEVVPSPTSATISTPWPETSWGFCRVLGLRKPLVAGHSWGGNVALHCAANYPSEVSGLAMVDGGYIEPSSLPGWTWERAREELAPPAFGQVTLRQITDRIKRGSLAPYMTPAIERILAANFYVTPEGFARPNLRRENHMKIVRALWEHKPSLLFPQVRCPTLILPARKDSPRPNQGQPTRIPGAPGREAAVQAPSDMAGRFRARRPTAKAPPGCAASAGLSIFRLQLAHEDLCQPVILATVHIAAARRKHKQFIESFVPISSNRTPY